eukprot:Plantae.Rhodophyta-Purpureofilum_apyrenoidigerum.ctg2880.p1 GENE.Plantae.Rhodophyta-Purpureofilum_apyrenoidigerum.ctg2880~~Plantae.Rhodophyta-Purpureofilum_apyrenoidigerum.ctg2880.p1  ORF type:complete len:357 (+),score=59.56 Plantae.Rhodophyta-Purpureofilum_apyrenoidigerum.ctg2880:1113-2183(+)
MEGSRYEKQSKLGEGTGGVVTKARDTETNRIVAVKKIRMGKAKDGISIEALREIKLLQEIQHPNVIELVDVFASHTNVNIVYEYCLTDLEEIIRDRTIFISPAEVKGCMLMILKGVEACHRHYTLHRDIKPNNILLGTDGQFKLADFGLARIHGSPNPRLTHVVVTRWYRAPELLFGARQYGAGIDIWAVGCVFAELLRREPYLPGDSDIDQLTRIFQARGTPTEAIWPGVSSLPAYVKFTDVPAPDQRAIFSAASEESIDLLNQFMAFNPSERISASNALKHRYFTTGVKPANAEDMLQKFVKKPIVEMQPPASAYTNAASTGQLKSPMIACRKDENGVSPPNKSFSGKRKLEFA